MSFFSRLFGSNNESASGENVSIATVDDIPEETFIEKTAPDPRVEKNVENEINQDNIQSLFAFLGIDFQQQGYDDALINPDTSYMNQNIDAILSDLEMKIKKVMTFYEDSTKQLDFLIESRGRLGMVDTVDEFKMKKERALRHMEKVIEMQVELSGQNRSSHRVTISYKRGFHNGMATIAHHESGRYKF